MHLEQYYESLSAEMMAVKNRVRELLGSKHWLTDGEHKETVLRQAIRRIAPRNMAVGRGFIASPAYTSTQIDVLVYDERYPVHYQDGDLFIIPPAACRAVIEVKSNLQSAADFRSHVDKQVEILSGLRATGVSKEVFCGLLYFDSQVKDTAALGSHLAQASGGDPSLTVNHVAVGKDTFFKFWENEPVRSRAPGYNSWHEYSMENKAFGYFLYNLVIDPTIVPADTVYFPPEGKERFFKRAHSLATAMIDESML